MKKILLFAFIFTLVSGAFAQPYKGVPWTGTAWTFGSDNNANFNVGNAYTHKKGIYNGVPHYLYDIGDVDTLKRAGDDLAGDLVAGSGIESSNAGAYTYRLDQAGTDSKTLSASDLAAIASPNFAGIFNSHQNRAVTDRSGGWYRYTVNFTEAGNYNLVLRCWGNDQVDQAFWFRMYEKTTMNPIIPWTRYHPGSGAGDAALQEGLAYLDMTQAPYDGYTITNLPSKTNWMKLNDEFTLSGEIVLEYCDPGPTLEYGESEAAGGSFGEFVFEHVGAAADKFAPVAEAWRDVYDEKEKFELKLSEPGTLYLVPNGTAEADLETKNIDKKEMTTDTYTKDASELLGDTIQIVTRDAAGNIRFSAPITVRNMLIADTTGGSQGDSVGVNVTRDGIIALIPPGVMPDYGSVLTAVAAGNADTAIAEAGGNTLVIRNLTGDLNCNLYMFDISGDVIIVSDPVPFQLGAEGGSIGIQRKMAEINLYVAGNQIILKHNGEFEDLYIYDLLGKQQMHRTVSSNRLELDASGLCKGVYIMKLYGPKEGLHTRKFLIHSW
ncbi:T9SS type A sorting domain-containing protein [Bacteroidota bacterium]